MLIDAHAHLDVDRPQLRTLLCGTEPVSAAKVIARRSETVIPCCAVHPWNADRVRVEEMLPYIEQCPVLGEIGLDSVWTDVDMAAQRRAFHAQLELAQQMKKPIVLHTKGMEAEIARTIARCDQRKLVHWYSCMEHLGMYLDQDCWFTVGPDWKSNAAVQQVLRRAPLDRLLTETDGLSAVEWALGRSVAPDEIPDVLRGELAAIAKAKGISPDEAERAVEANLEAFLGSALERSH